MTFHKHAHTRAHRNMFTVHCARAAVDLKSILELALLRIWPSNPLSSASCPWLSGWVIVIRIANNMPEVGDTESSCYASDCVKPEYNVVWILKQQRSRRLLARKGKECCNPSALLLFCFFSALSTLLLNLFYKLHVDDNRSAPKVSKWTNRFVSHFFSTNKISGCFYLKGTLRQRSDWIGEFLQRQNKKEEDGWHSNEETGA